MAEELSSIEDFLSKLRSYLESKTKRHPLAKPDVDSRTRSYLDNVHDILCRTDGKRTVSTKTIDDIFWLAEQGSWEILWKKYRDGTFQTATQELMTLKEALQSKYQLQASSPDVQTPLIGTKVPAVHQTPHGPKVPVEPELLSKPAGDNLKKGNPNIADLSDKTRQAKLAERFSELYDNEWCDAYEELMKITGGRSERVELDVIRKLLKVVQESRRFCSITIKSQMSKLNETLRQQMVQQDVDDDMQQSSNMSLTKEMRKAMEEAERHLKQAQRVTAPLSIPVLKLRFRKHMEDEFKKPSISQLKRLGLYIDECVEIIWLMSLQDPPMYLEECRPGDKSPPNFRDYTKRGSVVAALVWPSLHLYSRGPVLSKGVAVMM